MSLFKCNRSQRYKCESLAIHDQYLYTTKIVQYSLTLPNYDDTYFNTKHIIRFSYDTHERNNNYTTYRILLVFCRYCVEQSSEFYIEYFDKDERDRDLDLLIKMMSND